MGRSKLEELELEFVFFLFVSKRLAINVQNLDCGIRIGLFSWLFSQSYMLGFFFLVCILKPQA